MRKNITKQAFDEIQRLSGLNFTRKEIAKAVGCGISTVGAIRTAGTWENYEAFKKMQRERKHAKPNIENQDKYDSYIFVADMHAITVQQDPVELKKNIRNLIALYLASLVAKTISGASIRAISLLVGISITYIL